MAKERFHRSETWQLKPQIERIANRQSRPTLSVQGRVGSTLNIKGSNNA
jgi:hypothetical protein